MCYEWNISISASAMKLCSYSTGRSITWKLIALLPVRRRINSPISLRQSNLKRWISFMGSSYEIFQLLLQSWKEFSRNFLAQPCTQSTYRPLSWKLIALGPVRRRITDPISPGPSNLKRWISRIAGIALSLSPLLTIMDDDEDEIEWVSAATGSAIFAQCTYSPYKPCSRTLITLLPVGRALPNLFPSGHLI